MESVGSKPIELGGMLATIGDDFKALATDRNTFVSEVKSILEKAMVATTTPAEAKKMDSSAKSLNKKAIGHNKKLTSMIKKIDAAKIDSAKDMQKVNKEVKKLLKYKGNTLDVAQDLRPLDAMVTKYTEDLKKTNADITATEKEAKIKHSLVGKIKDVFGSLKYSRLERHSQTVLGYVQKNVDKFSLSEEDLEILKTRSQMVGVGFKG